MNTTRTAPRTRRVLAVLTLYLAILVGLAVGGLPMLTSDATPGTQAAAAGAAAGHLHGRSGPVADVVLASWGPDEDHATSHGTVTVPRTAAQVAFHDDMRKLWEDHVTWTRLAIVTFAADSPGFDATAGRLLANQAELGDAIRPYYGDAAGDRLTVLLTEHITIAVEILQAARSGDGAALTDAHDRWYVNGQEIADFLTAANPRSWPATTMRPAMAAHLDQTLDEAVAELTGDYPASVAAYDVAHLHMLDLADVLSSGIIAQFPRSFR